MKTIMFTKYGEISMPIWEKILVTIVIAFSISSVYFVLIKHVHFEEHRYINVTTELPPPKGFLVSRPEWSARTATGWLQKLSIAPPPYVIISHSAERPCYNYVQCKKMVKMIQDFHMDGNHWTDIGYNFLVGGDGHVYEGRGWDIAGSHAKGFNNRSIGISFIGTFITSAPTTEQIVAAKRLIEHGLKIGKISGDYKLLGHRQVSRTESPGETLFRIIQTWDHWSLELGVKVYGNGFYSYKRKYTFSDTIILKKLYETIMQSSDFDMLKRFDDGNFSVVYKVRRKENEESESDEILALKQQKSDDEWVVLYTHNEEKIIKKLNHPNVIGYYGSWLEDGRINLLIEFASGGNLLDLLYKAIDEDRKPMTESEALDFFSQLILGLDHMHSRNILHRDLKPENVLFSGPLKRVKIVDFNLSREVSSDEEPVPVVNPNNYSAIEVWNEEDHTFGSDVWSTAALLYEVVTGIQPEKFKDNDLEPLEDLPSAIKTICTSMLQEDPNDRPTTSELIRYPELQTPICEYYESLDIPQQKLVVEQVQDVIEVMNEISNSLE